MSRETFKASCLILPFLSNANVSYHILMAKSIVNEKLACGFTKKICKPLDFYFFIVIIIIG